MTRKYIGTKIITAWPQAGRAKVRVCGVDCQPSGEHCNGYCIGKAESPPAVNPPDGYAVKYEDGYISWSPKDVFEASYRAIERDGQVLTFGDALHMLKLGKKVARQGWNGKSMWLSLSGPGVRDVPASAFWSVNNAAYAEAQGGSAKVLPSITMKTATGEILMGWLASQSDMLAEDWMVVE